VELRRDSGHPQIRPHRVSVRSSESHCLPKRLSIPTAILSLPCLALISPVSSRTNPSAAASDSTVRFTEPGWRRSKSNRSRIATVRRNGRFRSNSAFTTRRRSGSSYGPTPRRVPTRRPWSTMTKPSRRISPCPSPSGPTHSSSNRARSVSGSERISGVSRSKPTRASYSSASNTRTPTRRSSAGRTRSDSPNSR